MRYAVIAPQKECCVHESCIFTAFCPQCPVIRLLLTLFLRHAETLPLSCLDLFPYSVELRKRMWKLLTGLLYYVLSRQYKAIAHSNIPSGKTSRCVCFLIFCVYYSLLGCDAIISENPVPHRYYHQDRQRDSPGRPYLTYCNLMRHIQEDGSLHSHRRQSLKSRLWYFLISFHSALTLSTRL